MLSYEQFQDNDRADDQQHIHTVFRQLADANGKKGIYQSPSKKPPSQTGPGVPATEVPILESGSR